MAELNHFIREAINNNLVKVKYMSTAVMLADMLTKCSNAVKHYMLLNSLGIIAI